MAVIRAVMTEVATIMQRVIIRFVFHNSIRRQIKHLHDCSFDSINRTLVVPISGPDAHDVLARPHAEYTPAHLVVKLVPDDRNDQILPHSVREPFAQSNDPLPSRYVHRIFPHRASDTCVEQEVVGGRRQEGG